MSGIIIRFTAQKREIGILKSECKGKESSREENNTDNSKYGTSDNKKRYLSLKFKCFNKYRNFEGKQLQEAECKNNLNNNKEKIAIKKEKTISKLELLPTNFDNKPSSVGLLKESISNKKDSSEPKRGKRVKINRTGERKECINHPYIRGVLKSIIKDLKDTSEEKSRRKHPNRRLQRERPESDLPVKKPRLDRPRSVVTIVKREPKSPERKEQRGLPKLIKEKEDSSARGRSRTLIVIKKEKEDYESHGRQTVKERGEIVSEGWEKALKCIKKEKCESESQVRANKMEKVSESKHAASRLWGKVLDTPRLWEGEATYIRRRFDVSDSESEDGGDVVDYKEMLEEFVLQTMEVEPMAGGKTLYERRVDEMLKDPEWWKEFYIPPALVEVLFQKMAQDNTADESLKRVCQERKWPKPEFTCARAGKDGFLYSCILNGKTFTPTKPASNEALAKELSALECLEWLGFSQRVAIGKSALKETYFP